MYAYAPNGAPILGSLERMSGRAEIVADSWKRDADVAKVDFEHEGSTEVFWNDMRTETNADDVAMYLDDDGLEWAENEIVLTELELTDDERFKMAEAYASAPKPESQSASAPKHETSRILVLSTAHLREESNDWLLAHPADKWPFRGMSDECGYFVSARADDPVVAKEFPEIAAAMECARSLGCEYLLYDRDGDTVDGLETFEW